MASIKPAAKGFRVQVSINGIRDSATKRTKQEAKTWGAQRETELRAQAATPASESYTLEKALYKYAVEVTPTHEGCHWEQIRITKLLRDAANPIGARARLPIKKRIGSVTTQDMAEWRDDRLKEVSHGSVLRELAILAGVFDYARREWQWITVNPLTDMKKPSRPHAREVTISLSQIRIMLRTMHYSPSKPPRSVSQAVGACLLLALRTGMRAQELCNLKFEHVHEEGYCQLVKSKTDKHSKPRDVPLTRKAMRLIERMKGWDNDTVFGLKPQTLDANFRKYRCKAKLEGFTFHDSRHTAATMIASRMRSSNIPAQQAVFDMCKMFGWKNIDQALVYYNPTAADIARRIA